MVMIVHVGAQAPGGHIWVAQTHEVTDLTQARSSLQRAENPDTGGVF